MKRALTLAALCGAGFGVACTAALAAFTARGGGASTVHATTMPATTTAPTVSVSGRDVSVSWTQRVMANGTAVAGYAIARYPAAGGSAVSVGAGCSGTVAALSCTELAVTPGSWNYTVTPVQGNAWHGTESAQSSSAAVASPSVSLSASVVAPSHAFTANIAGFDDGDAVSFHLGSASGTVIGTATASSAAGSNGTGSGSVTVPAGTASNTYTVYAVGSDTATTSVVVDATAPVVSASTIAATTTTPGYVAQGSSYYVYANASDSGGSNLASVTANVQNVTTGASSVTLTAGTYTVGATTYGFRSAALTAANPLAGGSKSYSVTATDGVGNSSGAVSGSVTVDNTAPTVSATVIAPTSGGSAGTISAGSSYYVYANASDSASGVATVTADVHNVTTGATSVALSSAGGPFTVNSVSYAYRSASQTADSGLSSGSKAYTVSATDNVGNASGAFSGSVTVAPQPPVVGAVAIAHTTNTTQAGSLGSNVSYYVYASVSAGSASISTVTADLHLVTSGGGKTALALSAGTYNVFGNTYNYRLTAPQTSMNNLSGTPTFTVTAKDTANVTGSLSGSVTADTTRPTVTSVTSTNNNGVVESGDSMVITFGKAIDPGTVNTATATTATFSQSGNGNVMLTIPGLVAQSDTGVAKSNGWVTNNNSVSYPGTLAMSNGNTTVTFTVSGPCSSGCTNVPSATANPGQMNVSPDTSATTLTDLAGNTVSGGYTYPTTGTIKVF